MSLEVDGRPGGVSIPHQDERRGFQVCERAGSLLQPTHALEPYTYGHLCKPEGGLGQGGSGHPWSMFHRGFLFVLVAVLAVVRPVELLQKIWKTLGRMVCLRVSDRL